MHNLPLYQRIYALIQQIPPGRVATYGQLARLVATTPRVVGFALAALPENSDVCLASTILSGWRQL